MSNEQATLEEPLELTGASGRRFKCDRLSPRALRRLESWLRRRRLRDFAAEQDGFKLNVIERAETISAIMRDEVATTDCSWAFEQQESAQLYVLWLLLLPHEPTLSESVVEREFGNVLEATVAELRAASLPRQTEEERREAEEKAKEAAGDEPPDPQSSADRSGG